MTVLIKLTRTQFKLYVREPMAFFFTMIFPAGLLALFGAIFGDIPFSGDMRYVDYATPALMVLVVVTVALMGAPVKTASDREFGVLRRFRITPLRPGIYMAADVIMYYLVSLAGALLLLLVGVLAFHLKLSESWPGVGLAFTLITLTFAAVGYLIAALAPSARVAQTIGMVLYFPMMFLSGASFPVEMMPDWLQNISKALPMTLAVELLRGLWLGDPWSDYLWQTLALFALLIICAFLAIRTFRWE